MHVYMQPLKAGLGSKILPLGLLICTCNFDDLYFVLLIIVLLGLLERNKGRDRES